MGFGFGEAILIVGVVLLFWGGRKIPELARGLGFGIRNFKGELNQPRSEDPEDDERGPTA